jgi:hypothetical protein
MPLRARLTAIILSTAALGASAAVTPSVALAGHYRLPIADFISESETSALSKAGITTTLALLDAVTTAPKRAELARKTSLSRDRIDALAGQVDLLRVEGIGPGVVRLLVACDIRDTRQLGAAGAAALHARMVSTNATTKILGAIPPEALVASWVSKARALPQTVLGLR